MEEKYIKFYKTFHKKFKNDENLILCSKLLCDCGVDRGVYISMSECLFCNIPRERIISENNLSFAIRDNFPVTHLHSLIIPKRHVSEYFSLTEEEISSCNSLLNEIKDSITKEDDSVEGFNIGVNSGEVAGQTIFHCHIHLIPRREGDVENPTGGVRGVIPEKQQY